MAGLSLSERRPVRPGRSGESDRYGTSIEDLWSAIARIRGASPTIDVENKDADTLTVKMGHNGRSGVRLEMTEKLNLKR